jgi:hypothetical protein
MSPKQIITTVICIVVILLCAGYIYKRWRDLNPRASRPPPPPPPVTAPQDPGAPPGG